MKQAFFSHAAAVLALALLPAAGMAFAANGDQHATADGVEIYYGLIPAAMIQGHTMGHGDKLTSKGTHHLVVALFDAKTGKRITGAKVSANVSAPAQAEQEKKLEPMEIKNTVSYGNYFYLVGAGPFRIRVAIQRPDMKRPVEAEFEYRRQ